MRLNRSIKSCSQHYATQRSQPSRTHARSSQRLVVALVLSTTLRRSRAQRAQFSFYLQVCAREHFVSHSCFSSVAIQNFVEVSLVFMQENLNLNSKNRYFICQASDQQQIILLYYGVTLIIFRYSSRDGTKNLKVCPVDLAIKYQYHFQYSCHVPLRLLKNNRLSYTNESHHNFVNRLQNDFKSFSTCSTLHTVQ